MTDRRVLCFLGLGNLRTPKSDTRRDAEGVLASTRAHRTSAANAPYLLTHYDSPDGIEAYCAPHYLAQRYGLTTITVAVTRAVRGPTKDGTESELDKLERALARLTPPCAVEPLDIPDGATVEELWMIFDLLVDFLRADTTPVHLDVTHGFRHVPILCVLVAQYAEALGAGAVEAMTYAALDMGRKGLSEESVSVPWAPVLDLKPLVELLDWNVGAAVFRETGRGRHLAELTTRLGNDLARARAQGGREQASFDDLQPLKAAATSLERLSDDLLALRVKTLQEPEGSASFAGRSLGSEAVRSGVVAHAKPLGLLLEGLASTAMGFREGGAPKLLRWYAAHDQVLHALALGNEHLVNIALRALRVPDELHLDRDTRERVRRAITSLAASSYAGDALPPAVSAAREACPLLCELAEWASKLGDFRNDAMHAEQRRQSKSARTLRRLAVKLADDLADLELRLMGEVDVDVPKDPSPLPAFNATCHDQGEHVAQLMEQGYVLVPDYSPHVGEVDATLDFEGIVAEARSLARRAEQAGAHALLVGGMTSLAIALVDEARRRWLGVVEVATPRRRDPDDRFVFEFGRVRTIVPTLGGTFRQIARGATRTEG